MWNSGSRPKANIDRVPTEYVRRFYFDTLAHSKPALDYLVRTFELRKPRSVTAVTLLDRPYRRLVDDLPVQYVGFVVPDELFVGFGFDLEEQWRHLPDLHLLRLGDLG